MTQFIYSYKIKHLTRSCTLMHNVCYSEQHLKYLRDGIFNSISKKLPHKQLRMILKYSWIRVVFWLYFKALSILTFYNDFRIQGENTHPHFKSCVLFSLLPVWHLHDQMWSLDAGERIWALNIHVHHVFYWSDNIVKTLVPFLSVKPKMSPVTIRDCQLSSSRLIRPLAFQST